MTNITQAQRAALIAATQNPQGALDATLNSKIAKSLIKKGWAMSIPLAEGGERLAITDAGRAITVEGDEPAKDDAAVQKAGAGDEAKPARPARATRKSSTEWPTGKLGILVTLLQRPEGANLAEMTAATGWQTHSVRGAMSGALKKGFGFVIDSQKTEAGRTYRIVADGAA